MTRISKKAQRRAVSPRRPRASYAKACCSCSKNDNGIKGFKPHENAVEGNAAVFIPKIK